MTDKTHSLLLTDAPASGEAGHCRHSGGVKADASFAELQLSEESAEVSCRLIVKLPSDFALFGFQVADQRDQVRVEQGDMGFSSLDLKCDRPVLKIKGIQWHGRLAESASLMQGDLKGHAWVASFREVGSDEFDVRKGHFLTFLCFHRIDSQSAGGIGMDPSALLSLKEDEPEDFQVEQDGIGVRLSEASDIDLALGEVFQAVRAGDLLCQRDFLFLKEDRQGRPALEVSSQGSSGLGCREPQGNPRVQETFLAGGRSSGSQLVHASEHGGFPRFSGLQLRVDPQGCGLSTDLARGIAPLDPPKRGIFAGKYRGHRISSVPQCAQRYQKQPSKIVQLQRKPHKTMQKTALCEYRGFESLPHRHSVKSGIQCVPVCPAGRRAQS